jgi:hypothetical protein
LIGKKAVKEGIEEAVLDKGLHRATKELQYLQF